MTQKVWMLFFLFFFCYALACLSLSGCSGFLGALREWLGGNNELHILPEWRNKRKDVPDWWLGSQPGVCVCVCVCICSQEMEIHVRWWVARYVIFPLWPESPLSPFPCWHGAQGALFSSRPRSSGLVCVRPTHKHIYASPGGIAPAQSGLVSWYNCSVTL